MKVPPEAPTPETSHGRYRRVVSTLFHLTKVVNSGASLSELLAAVTDSSTSLVGADTASIMLLDEGRAALLTKAASGLSEEQEAGISFKIGEGVAGWVAEHAAPALISDATSDARFKTVGEQKTTIASLLVVPLVTKEGVIGTLSVTSARAGAFTKDHEELLMYLGSSIVKDIENARLYRLSITDSLTRAYNRQYLYQRLPDEMERARRYSDPLALVLFDVDHFKRLNDTYGHPAGDFVLKEIVRVVHATIREVDGLVRYGGEEFVMLLPKTTLEGAVGLAERLRAAIEGTDFLWSDTKLKVTSSFGVAALSDETRTDEALLKRADEALYEAKNKGRNRVVAG